MNLEAKEALELASCQSPRRIVEMMEEKETALVEIMQVLEQA